MGLGVLYGPLASLLERRPRAMSFDDLFSSDYRTLSYDDNQFVRYGTLQLRKVKPSTLLPAVLIKEPRTPIWVLDAFVFDADKEATSVAYLQEYALFLENMKKQLMDFATSQGIEGLFTCLDANSHDTS